MVGIGHMLAEGEMRKEAISPAVRNIGIGAAATAVAGHGYVAHRYGKDKAEQDFKVKEVDRDGTVRPKHKWALKDHISAGSIGKWAYGRRRQELMREESTHQQEA